MLTLKLQRIYLNDLHSKESGVEIEAILKTVDAMNIVYLSSL